MRFAKIVFRVAGVFGIVGLLPLYFLFDLVGSQMPPAVTHPEFYYGFAGVALAWQVAFLVMSQDPVRFRPLMIPSVLEKLAYAGALFVLYAQGRLAAPMLGTAVADFAFAILFAMAYVKTAPRA